MTEATKYFIVAVLVVLATGAVYAQQISQQNMQLTNMENSLSAIAVKYQANVLEVISQNKLTVSTDKQCNSGLVSELKKVQDDYNRNPGVIAMIVVVHKPNGESQIGGEELLGYW